jgi:Skp family chaperone for outer membrane proteins
MVKNVHCAKRFLLSASLSVFLLSLFNVHGGDVKSESRGLESNSVVSKDIGDKTQSCKIGLIDMGVIFKNCEPLRVMNEKLKPLLEKIQKEYEEIMKKFQEESKKLTNRINALKGTDASDKKLRKQLADLELEAGKNIERLRREQAAIQNKQQQKVVEIQRLLSHISTSVAEKNGCDMIINSEALLYYNPERCADYTQVILERLNSVELTKMDPMNALEPAKSEKAKRA